MKTYISLLRGINVSGQKKILMKDLTAMYESLKFESVKTYIQSGNVVFKTKKSAPMQLSAKVQDILKTETGFDVYVHTLDAATLRSIVENNPYKAENIESLYIAFLSEQPQKEWIEKLELANTGNNQFTIKGDVVYLHYQESYGNSKLNNNFLEAKLKLKATTRNLKTINTLIALSA